MEPFKDLLKTISNRISSPITGTFLISWFITNWRISLAIIFGSPNQPDRIKLVEEIAEDSNLYQLVLIPIVITIFYLFLMPVIREWYDKFVTIFEYRSAKVILINQEDLHEVKMYRDTLKSLNSILYDKLQQTYTTFQQISLLTKPDVIQPTEEHVRMIYEKATQAEYQLSKIKSEMSYFYSTYNDDIPKVIDVLLSRWGKQKSIKASK